MTSPDMRASSGQSPPPSADDAQFRLRRQVGGYGVVGQIAKGSVMHGTRTASSIPTRFETILNDQQREKKGFASSALRFEDRRDADDLPGPGSYDVQSSSPLNSSRSLAPGGGGGGSPLVSGTNSAKRKSQPQRWFQIPVPSAAAAAASAQQQQATQKGSSSSTSYRDAVASRPSAAFQKPLFDATYEENLMAKKRQLPGPGQYKPEEYGAMDKARHVPGSAAFRATARRDAETSPSRFTGSTLSPASGAGRPLSRSGSATGAAEGRPSTFGNFVSSKVKAFTEIPAKSPPKDPRPSPAFASHSTRSVSPGTTSTLELPGPGYYEASETQVDRTKLPPKRPGLPAHKDLQSAVFRTTLDRFGNPLSVAPEVLEQKKQSGGPAPGQYYKPAVVKKQSISSSFFISSVPKGGASSGAYTRLPREKREVHIPGPAYYVPKDLKKKSFHMNMGGTWL